MISGNSLAKPHSYQHNPATYSQVLEKNPGLNARARTILLAAQFDVCVIRLGRLCFAYMADSHDLHALFQFSGLGEIEIDTLCTPGMNPLAVYSWSSLFSLVTLPNSPKPTITHHSSVQPYAPFSTVIYVFLVGPSGFNVVVSQTYERARR